MSRSRKACRVLVAVAATGAVALASPPSAGSRVGATATLQGEAVVGSTLTATLTPNDPAALVVVYRWQRCAADLRPGCVGIDGAAPVPSYTVAAADLGNRIAVRVLSIARGAISATGSPMTGVVTAPAAPATGPTPTSTPLRVSDPKPPHEPKPPHVPKPPKVPDLPQVPQVPDTAYYPKPHHERKPHPKWGHHDDPAPLVRSDSPPAAPAPAAALPPPLLRPFPVVRVKGTLLRDGARISLLRVTAPATATVDVRCKGPRCNLRRRSAGGGRIAALERYLRAGTRITIRVSNPQAVGKYVHLVIRDGAAPRRRDACLMPGSDKPVECPAA
jgi:hypothetical protein